MSCQTAGTVVLIRFPRVWAWEDLEKTEDAWTQGSKTKKRDKNGKSNKVSEIRGVIEKRMVEFSTGDGMEPATSH